MISFEVKWGTKKLDIELTQEAFDAMTVSDLKLKCQQLTEVEPPFMKLIVKGGTHTQHITTSMSDLIMYTQQLSSRTMHS